MAKRTEHRFVVCVSNENYAASLEPRKIYLSLPDPQAKKLGMRRVIDESGDDYLFPDDLFVELSLPRDVSEAISRAVGR